MGYWNDVWRGFVILIASVIFIALIILVGIGIVWLVILNFHIVLTIAGILILVGIILWILKRFCDFLASVGRENEDTASSTSERFRKRNNKCKVLRKPFLRRGI